MIYLVLLFVMAKVHTTPTNLPGDIHYALGKYSSLESQKLRLTAGAPGSGVSGSGVLNTRTYENRFRLPSALSHRMYLRTSYTLYGSGVTFG